MTTRPPDFNFVEPSAEPLLTFNTLAELAAFQPYDSALHEGRLVLVKGSASAWDELNGGFYRLSRAGASSAAGAILLADGRAQAIPTTLGRIGQRQERNRYAAKSLGGSSGTAGAFAGFAWDPGQDVTVSFVYASATAPSATVSMFGNAAANKWNVQFLTTGEIEFREATTQRAITAAGVAKYDGYSHTVSLRVTGTTVAITHDGVAVGSGTFSSVTWANSTWYIGAAASTSSQRWPGAIWNLEGTDAATPANGFTFLMDEPRTSPTFFNTLSGTSVGNATKGTGQAFPFETSVVSTDGRGMPFQGAAPLMYSAYASADLSGVAADGGLAAAFDVEESDPTTSLVAGTLTAPANGVVEAWLCATVTETGAVADEIGLGFTVSALIGERYHKFTFAASATEAVNVGPVVIPVVQGNTVAPYLALRTGGTFRIEDHSRVTYRFTPTPTTG